MQFYVILKIVRWNVCVSLEMASVCLAVASGRRQVLKCVQEVLFFIAEQRVTTLSTHTVTDPSVWHRVRCADAEVSSLLVSAVPAFRRRYDPSKRRNCTPDTASSRTRLTTCIESLGPKDFYRVHNGLPRSLSWSRSVYFPVFHPTLFRFTLILPFHLHLRFPSALFPSYFATSPPP